MPAMALPAKAAHRLMRDVNRSLVLQILRSGELMTRVELARRTRLSKPTVSAIVDELRREELVTEIGQEPARPKGGRPATLISYNAAADAYAAVQFGPHRVGALVADGLGQPRASGGETLDGATPEKATVIAAALVRRLCADAGVLPDRIRTVGVAVAGLVERDTGVCVLAPNLRWRDVPLGLLMTRALGVPAVVVNTVTAAAHAERLRGAAHEVEDFVWVYAGTGIGAAVVSDGHRHAGVDGFAGELGHCVVAPDGPRCECGNRGCLEAVAGAAAITRQARAAARDGRLQVAGVAPTRIQAVDVARSSDAGDAQAQSLLAESGALVGLVVSHLVNLVNPALVVVGGPMVESGNAFLTALQGAVRRHSLASSRVEVVRTALGDSAALEGAVGFAVEAHRAPQPAVLAAAG